MTSSRGGGLPKMTVDDGGGGGGGRGSKKCQNRMT